jgi:hypothetical protein
MPVQQLGGLVREVAHEASGERGQLGEPGPGQRTRHLAELLANRELGPGGCDGQTIAPDVADGHPVPAGHHDRRGVPGGERVPPPPLGPLHALQEHAGTVAHQGREYPDRRGHVGEQLGPHRDERPLRGELVEGLPVGPHLHVSPPRF